MHEKEFPLSDIRVVDFSTIVAAPTAARLLADMGATVIKVEKLSGDPTRYQDTIHVTDPGSYSFTCHNANKRCISIDIKTEGGKEAFLRLLEGVDVLITNVRYKSLQRAGLDYETLKEKFPKLIYAHFAGYGYKGPDADLPAYDTSAFWDRGGALLDRQVQEDGRLWQPPYGLGDICSSGYFAAGILAALRAAERTGHGTMISTSLLHTGVWANGRSIIAAQKAIGEEVPMPEESNSKFFSRPYLCADGKWLGLCLAYTEDFQDAFEIFGMEDLLGDPRYATMKAVRRNGLSVELTRRIAEAIAKQPLDYWVRALRERDMVYATVPPVAEISEDPQVLENGYMQPVVFQNGAEVLIPSIPVQFSDFDVREITPGATLGEDTRDIMGSLGYTDEQIDALVAGGCVK